MTELAPTFECENPSPASLISRPTIPTLDDTGERMVPEKSGAVTFWEHIYRYRFATRFVRNKRVLDIACGEGYGTAALVRTGAASVVGIDVSEQACEHARRKYGVDARPGSAERIPLQDNSVDVVVSFETVEHIAQPERFLDECARVLAPGGMLIISTPNRQAIEAIGGDNPFHCSELDEEEFVSLIRPRFQRHRLYMQRLETAAWWSARPFAAITSPWLRMRGIWRLRALLRRMLCPHIFGHASADDQHVFGEADEEYRRSPDRMILAADRLFAPFVNPYQVRKWPPGKWHWGQPMFLIAVARLKP